MQKISILLILLFTVQSFIAQLPMYEGAEIIWGEELKFRGSDKFTKFLGEYKNNYYLIKSLKNGFKYEINVFGSDMNLKQSAIIDMKHHGNYKMKYVGSFLIGNKIYVFSSFPDKKKKINKLYCRAYDINSLTSGELVEIDQFPYEKPLYKGSFNIETSDDKSHLLVYLEKPYKKKATEKFGLTVMDSDLNIKWRKDIELPYTDQFFSNEGYQINNDGDVYLLGKEYKEEKGKRNIDKLNYTYHILAYLDNGKKFKDYELNLKDKFITDITYKIAQNGDLICSGFYSKNGTYSTKGAFYMTVDFDTRKVKHNSIKEFDENFIIEGLSDREVAKAKKDEQKSGKAIEMYNYNLKDFVLREDGGAVLIAEQYYVRVTTTTRTVNGVMTTYTYYHYYYNDIIVVNISPKGEIEWATKIDKYQYSVNDDGYYSSYVLHVDDNRLHLIYNERAKYYFEKEERKNMSRNDKKAKLTIIATVESNGDYKKDILINVSDESTYPVPKLSEQINEKELLLYTRKIKKRRFALVKFK